MSWPCSTPESSTELSRRRQLRRQPPWGIWIHGCRQPAVFRPFHGIHARPSRLPVGHLTTPTRTPYPTAARPANRAARPSLAAAAPFVLQPHAHRRPAGQPNPEPSPPEPSPAAPSQSCLELRCAPNLVRGTLLVTSTTGLDILQICRRPDLWVGSLTHGSDNCSSGF